MTRPILPPRGIFVPVNLIFNRDLSSPAFHTWIKLRCLAWGALETPPLNVKEIAEHTGISPSALYGHLALLRKIDALRWRTTGRGILKIIFFDDPVIDKADSDGGFPGDDQSPADPLDSRFLESGITDSRFQESGIPLSLNQLIKKENLEERGEGGDSRFQDSGIDEPEPGFSRTGGSGKSISSGDFSTAGDPIAIYRRLTGLRPNVTQREQIKAQVVDLDLWQHTLEHWQMHGWNPKNLHGLLELYARRGPSGCTYCNKSKDKDKPKSNNPTLDAIQRLRERYSHDPDQHDPDRS